VLVWYNQDLAGITIPPCIFDPLELPLIGLRMSRVCHELILLKDMYEYPRIFQEYYT